MPGRKKFNYVNGYIVTWNAVERTYTIYNRKWEFLSTVNEGELLREIQELDSMYGGE